MIKFGIAMMVILGFAGVLGLLCGFIELLYLIGCNINFGWLTQKIKAIKFEREIKKPLSIIKLKWRIRK